MEIINLVYNSTISNNVDNLSEYFENFNSEMEVLDTVLIFIITCFEKWDNETREAFAKKIQIIQEMIDNWKNGDLILEE